MEVIEFSAEEIQQRVRVCQQNLVKNQMKGLIISNKYNLYYYSNYRPIIYETSYTRTNYLFIPREGKPVVLVHLFNEQDARLSCTSFFEVRMFKNLRGPSMEELQSVFEDLDMCSGKVGMELGYEQRIDFEVQLFEKMKEQFKEVEYVDASDLIWNQRMYKSETEALCVQKACEATSYAFDRIFDEIHEGMTEAEVARLMKQYMLEGGADDLKGSVVCIGEENYPRISKVLLGNRKLQKGDFVWIDAQADYRGYSSDFCRAGIVGNVSKEREEMQDLIHRITMNTIRQLKPGMTAADVAGCCKDEFIRAGYGSSFECGRFGHGVGLLVTEPPSITLDDQTVLAPGMIITIEPGIVNEYGVFDIEENILITADGYKILSGSSRKLHEIKG